MIAKFLTLWLMPLVFAFCASSCSKNTAVPPISDLGSSPIDFAPNSYMISSPVHLPLPMLGPSTKRFPFDYSGKIDSAKKFAEIFLRMFRDSVRKGISPKSIGFVRFMDDHRLGLSMIISNTRDSYLGIFDQGNPQFVVSATDYPVQMVLLYHLDLGPGRFSESLEATLKRYDDAPGYFDLNGGCVAFTGGYIKGATKIFNLDSGIVCLDSFSLSGKLSDNSVAASFVCVGLGFLTSIKDFDSNSKCLPVLASMVAHYEIENLFFKSEYFRKVKLYQSLFPQAYEMQRKYDDDRANHKPYAFVEFQEDAKKLDQAVAQLGLSGKFAKNLLDEAGSYLTPGTLLYHFSDYWGFTIQWIILNVIAIVLLPLLRVILKIGKIVEGFIRRASPYVIVCSINLWAFNRRPDSLPFLYWIIPGLLFVAALLLAHWWFPDPKKKANI